MCLSGKRLGREQKGDDWWKEVNTSNGIGVEKLYA